MLFFLPFHHVAWIASSSCITGATWALSKRVCSLVIADTCWAALYARACDNLRAKMFRFEDYDNYSVIFIYND
jgi:hypothetical protein